MHTQTIRTQNTTNYNQIYSFEKKEPTNYEKPEILAITKKGEPAFAKCKDKPGIWCKSFW